MTNLPSRRVIRSRPFEHVGLDYFGPLTISTKKEGDNKVYGCIITCTTTRLIHLELVTNMTTQCFINALRRFIARRGVPSTITSDNANTFTLGDQVLASLTKEGDKEPAFDELMSKKGITWHYNTPYSPWQGGFYERLIKIVKHSLYKTLGKKVVNLDDLSTLLTEIEATDDYTPSADMYQLRTRKEAEQALRESHSRTEKFWDIWRSQYLKNLREHHQHNMRGKREGTRIPNINDVVLISDPIQPRNVLLPNRRLIQRPTEINREPLTTKKDVGQSPCSPRYNLRERKKVNYKERDELEEDNSYHVNTIHRSPRINPTTMIYLLTMLMLVHPIASTTLDIFLQCTKTGIQIVKGDADSYEICIDNYCWTYTDPGDKETIYLSPSITLHEYVVYWKIRREDKLKVIAVTCPATPFCANINCNLCTEMLANPSCWPKTAIVTTGVVIYALLLCLYFLCYVPVILASPLLLIFRGVWYGLWAGTHQVVKLASSAFRALGHQFHQRRQQQRNLNLWNSKCAKINRTSIITELQAANDYPGITRCVESCGGLGCDCFYPSSGCLFYRIYLLPIDEKKYEIYRCTRWREAVLVHISIIDKYRKNSVETTVMMKPNIPYQGNNMTITLSELALPPTPILADQFVTDGTNTARWLSEYKLPLRCATREEAQTFNCTLVEDCLCSPAENTIRCDCKNQNITQIFNNIANRLPFTTPSVEFTQIKSSVRATIKSLATAEFILHLEETSPVSINVQDTTCSIDSTHLEGCYACAKGAKAIVNCIAEKVDQMAEIKCDEHSFTIPCSSQGQQSTLSFSYNQAKIHTRCEIKCGKTPTYVEIAGILRYTGNLQQSLRRIISGESKTFSEINIPDIGHIAEVFIHWYTTTIFTVIGICIALLVTYLYFATCGARILSSIYRLFFRVIGGVGRYFRRKQRRKKTETKQF
uniref:Integrase catalytic domain-containing protein n=1 Tax=Heterorhabditis bacteriophora TaxID=37862 RepID=A0A1I7WRF6_HETBA